MKRVLSLTSVLVLLLGSSLSAAQDPPAKETPGESKEVRRDAKGEKGISPAMEAIAAGRADYATKNYGAAITNFEKAAKEDTDKALAHYLIAQTKLTLGDAAAALQALKTATSFKPQASLAAKILFFEAEVSERLANQEQGSGSLREALVTKWEAARDAWTSYAVYLRVNTTLPDHKASADDRKAQITARRKRDKDYGEVKQRIAENAKRRAAKAAKKKK